MNKNLNKASITQPRQLDLYQMLINDTYSNSVEFYQSLPDLFSWKQDKLRNDDWTLPVLQRHGIYNGKNYSLDISPANITLTKSWVTKQKRAFYKTVIAEFVEYALHKLAVSTGFFSADENNQIEDFNLVTTYYAIREELKRMGKAYSYEQIKDAISILAWLRYELTGEISKEYDINSFFSPIDITIRHDRKNPLHSELHISFNKLISKRILALDWRTFNYEQFMQVKTSFWRTLFLRLINRFPQADPRKGYHFLLSTIIKEWALQDDLITTNIKKVDEAIEDCSYLIESAKTEKLYTKNRETNRKMLADYKVTLFPTKAFQQEQYRSNVHHKNLSEHRVTKDGETVIKPMRDQYPTRHDFERFQQDQKNYEKAWNQ